MDVTRGTMYASIPLAVWYTVTCSACDETVQLGRDVGEGMMLPIMCVPEDWVVLVGKAYCPKHHIVIRVDGEKKVYRPPGDLQ